MFIGLCECEPDKCSIDERENTRHEKWNCKSELEEKSSEQWSDHHSHTKHHTKYSVIFGSLLTVFGDIRENSLCYSDITSRHTIDDAPHYHPPHCLCKCSHNPSHCRTQYTPEEEIFSSKFIRKSTEIWSRNKTTQGIYSSYHTRHQIGYLESVHKCWENRKDNSQSDEIEGYSEENCSFRICEFCCIHTDSVCNTSQLQSYLMQ